MSAGAVRADWSSVTLAEYDALRIIRREDAETLLNRYWDGIADYDLCRDPGEPATRLTDEGSAWLAGLRETYYTTPDERELIRIARDFVASMGTLLTCHVAREIRQEGVR